MHAHLITAAALLLMLTPALGSQPEAPDFIVIVSASNTTRQVDRRFLANAFLKKITRWPDGDAIRPVDLEPGAAARRSFTASVLDRSVAAVKSYWQQIIFTGNGLPPPELASDEAVIAYIRTHDGAVGYVSTQCVLRGVKPLTVR